MSVTDSGNDISFTSIERGTDSGIQREMKEVFRSKEQFDKFWGRHTSIDFPRRTLPVIDFETHMVACVFTGTKPSGGYGISVVGVKDTDTDLIVQYETEDPDGAMTTQAMTQPFEFIQIPIPDDTSKRVTFEEKTTIMMALRRFRLKRRSVISNESMAMSVTDSGNNNSFTSVTDSGNNNSFTSVTDSGNNNSFTSIERGTDSGIQREMKKVFRSKEQFDKFWRRHTSIDFPRRTPPVIDFETHMIACVFRGTKRSGGYGISVVGVKDTDTDLIVQYETEDPPRGAILTFAMTQPFEFIQIPIPDDTSKRVTFEEITTIMPPRRLKRMRK